MELLNAARALLSHAHPGATLAEVIASLAERYVKQKTGGKSTAVTSADMTTTDATSMTATSMTVNSAAEVATSQNKPVPASIKKAILRESEGCQFRDPKTGKICGSGHFPQVDHLQPRFAGGGNEPANLRHLCSQHNQYRYRAGC